VTVVDHTDESGLAWRIEAAYAEVVRREIADRLGALADDATVETIKSNRVRTVLRVTLRDGPRGDEEVFVKRYHPTGARATAKSLLRASRARQEWAMARALEEAGIPTAHPIAWAERRRGRVVTDAAYVCRGVAAAVDFVPYLREHAPDPSDPAHRELRRDLFGRLADLARRQHDAGIDHPDLHSGNVLVTRDGDEVGLHVIDLHGASQKAAPLTVACRVRRLAKILHSLSEIASRTDRLRFLRRYARDGSLPDVREAFAETEERLHRIEKRRRASRAHRCLEDSRQFGDVREGAWRIRHLREIPWRDLLDAVVEHDRALAADEVVKRGHRSAVTRAVMGETPVVVKSMWSSAPRTWLGTVLGRLRGRRSWFLGHALLVREVGVARPLGYLLEHRGPVVRREVLVMEDVSRDGERLDHLVLRLHREGRLHGHGGRTLLVTVAEFVRDLHRDGVYHGDLKACNLYVRGPVDESPEIRVVDYDRVRVEKPVSFRRRVKNLAQLSASIPVCVTRTDRLRFFRLYAPTSDIERDWKRYARAVEEACREKTVVEMEPIE
jgi:tRNA A-37 threonylcarbamoyl transferase component Bud32